MPGLVEHIVAHPQDEKSAGRYIRERVEDVAGLGVGCDHHAKGRPSRLPLKLADPIDILEQFVSRLQVESVDALDQRVDNFIARRCPASLCKTRWRQILKVRPQVGNQVCRRNFCKWTDMGMGYHR